MQNKIFSILLSHTSNKIHLSGKLKRRALFISICGGHFSNSSRIGFATGKDKNVIVLGGPEPVSTIPLALQRQYDNFDDIGQICGCMQRRAHARHHMINQVMNPKSKVRNTLFCIRTKLEWDSKTLTFSETFFLVANKFCYKKHFYCKLVDINYKVTYRPLYAVFQTNFRNKESAIYRVHVIQQLSIFTFLYLILHNKN